LDKDYSPQNWEFIIWLGRLCVTATASWTEERYYSTTTTISKGGDILAFPSKDFPQMARRHKKIHRRPVSDQHPDKSEPINIAELNLALDVLSNITEELEIYSVLKQLLTSYHHISTWTRNIKKEQLHQ